MSNKAQLQENNSSLAEILAKLKTSPTAKVPEGAIIDFTINDDLTLTINYNESSI